MSEHEKLPPAERRNAALRAALRVGDPGADTPALDVERLRRRLRAAHEESALRPVRRPWLPLAAVAASLAVLWIVASGRRAPELAPVRGGAPETAPQASVATASATGAGEVRQMQFETPGGTRIIWVMAAHLD